MILYDIDGRVLLEDDRDDYRGLTKQAREKGISLKRANFQNAEIRDEHFDGLELDEAVFDNAKLYDSTFRRCGLDHTKWINTSIYGCAFTCADLHSAQFQGGTITRSSFAHADANNAQFVGLIMVDVHFLATNLSYTCFEARLYEVSFENANLTWSELAFTESQAEFGSTTRMPGANLTDADIRLDKVEPMGNAFWSAYNVPYMLMNLRWPVIVSSHFIRIGAAKYPREEWLGMTESDLNGLFENGSAFWRQHKNAILALSDCI